MRRPKCAKDEILCPRCAGDRNAILDDPVCTFCGGSGKVKKSDLAVNLAKPPRVFEMVSKHIVMLSDGVCFPILEVKERVWQEGYTKAAFMEGFNITEHARSLWPEFNKDGYLGETLAAAVAELQKRHCEALKKSK